MGERRRSALRETVETIAVALVLTILIRHFVAESFVVRGSSMEPTLHDGERLLVSKFIYRFRPPRSGEIIVFRSPVRERDDLIKRVIAVPGDHVALVDGQVVRNGQPLDEPYIMSQAGGNLPDRVVPEGHVFVLGDNRPNSEDSRYFGFVPVDRIKGKAFLVWWPVAYAGLLP